MSDTIVTAINPAEAYEQYMVPAMFGPWAARLVTSARPQPGERVLDLACGTGVVARRIAPKVAPDGQVDALDINPVMLEVGRSTATREGVAISFHHGNMEALQFSDESYDLVTCQQGLQFVPDRSAAVRELHRVLVDGGRAVVSCWTSLENSPLIAALAPIVEQHAGVPALNAPFSLSGREELESLFDQAGFSTVQIDEARYTARFPQGERFVEMTIGAIFAAIPSMQQTPPEERERLTTVLGVEMKSVLREFTDGDEILSPTHTHIAHAWR
jgi:2-polyprenyl-3-methyl-5-hydroxy-6-metoxy-1,4-benzoquinol methylase